MTIYGKTTYVTKHHRKLKPRELINSGITPKTRMNVAMDNKYGTAKKHKCYKCGELVFLIKGKIHDLEAGEAGCHEIHRCK